MFFACLCKNKSYLYIVLVMKLILKPKTMYTEAFLFVGNLLQDGKIEEIVFNKKGFRVRFKGEKHLFNYKYTQEGIIEFLELYETY